ncbi:MAG: hypothetical protein ACYS8S_02465 [Planctomycetota bacterium]
MQIPCFTHHGDRRGVAVKQGTNTGVVFGLRIGAAGAAKRDDL